MKNIMAIFNLPRSKFAGGTPLPLPEGVKPSWGGGGVQAFRAASKVVCALALEFLSSCGPVDRRHELVVVDDPMLQAPVEEAMRFWRLATCGDVELEFATECEGLCITVAQGSLPWPDGGLTIRHSSGWSTITIKPDLLPATRQVIVTHELGHALGLDHVPDADPPEIMFVHATNYACSGPGTRREYERRYGPRDCWRELCEP